MASSVFLTSNKFFLSLIDKLEQKKTAITTKGWHSYSYCLNMCATLLNETLLNHDGLHISYMRTSIVHLTQIEAFYLFILSYNLHSRTQINIRI